MQLRHDARATRSRPNGPRRTTPWRVGATVVALGLTAAACSATTTAGTASTSAPPGTTLDKIANPNAPKDGQPRDGGTLRFAIEADTNGWNPAVANFALPGNLVASSVYDPLMKINEKRLLEPYLAESVTPNADATVWTIKARAGVKFHDGTPFDGKALFANFNTRKTSGLGAIALEPIKKEGGVVQIDDMTIQVNMDRPWAAYDYTLAAQGGYMAAPRTLDGSDPNPIGTGPFMWDAYTPGKDVKVKKNPNYWQKGKPHLDGIDFQILGDEKTREQALEARDIDAMMTENPVSVAKFRDEPGYVQAEDLSAEETFVMLNMGAPPFDNAHARKALAYATDRRTIIDTLTGGFAHDADQPYIDSEYWFVPDAGYVSFDAAKAKSELDAYLKDSGQTKLSFELQGYASPFMTLLTQTLEQQWAAIGVEVKINLTEQASYLQNIIVGKYQAGMFRNFAYVDPDSNYIFWSKTTAKGLGVLSINFTQLKDDELEAGLDKGRVSTDRATRKDAYATVVRRINANVPYLWLFHNLWAIAATDKVGGLKLVQDLGFARQDAKPWWGDLYLAA